MKNESGRDDQTISVDNRIPYEQPAIIYKGKINTRAGTPISIPDGSTSVVDPADLFGDD
ncbi:MAG TPA: hypothetical protein PLD25_24380 [Chloroflexota bacterium]|nr:hypothetical protein [Chloroflexota bacterium]